MSITGALFSSAMASSYFDVDPAYPKIYDTVTNPNEAKIFMDSCLTSLGLYGDRLHHYTMVSPCILDQTRKALNRQIACSSDAECNKGFKEFVQKSWPTKALTPVGVALDGRVIYGPFDSTGKLWQPCDVDVCNGRYFGNEYAYVATMFHPYTVGCFGPGNYPHLT